jgi:hypothetical protein
MATQILSTKTVILCWMMFIACSIAKVIVYAPQQLKESVIKKKGNNEGFVVSLANFGIIPYGHSLIGRIYYDPENSDGCKPFGDFDFSNDPDDAEHPTPIFLVDRGNCTFVKKVRNVEHAGGRLGIVMDNQQEDVSNVIMSDDGTGMGIMIPSLLIGKGDGQLLKQFLEDNGGMKYMKKAVEPEEDEGDVIVDEKDVEDITKNKKKKKAKKDTEKTDEQKLIEQSALLVSFEMPHPDQRVEYDIWYSSIDDRALDFMTEFQKYDEMLNDKVLMTPHFVTWGCPDCEEAFKKTECFGDGKYCAILHNSISMNGKEIIMEDLRQQCIYKKNPTNKTDLFWEYIREAHSLCPGYINADCSKQAHTKLKMDYKSSMDCVDDTFRRGDSNDYRDENTALAREKDYWNQYGAHFYPSIVINNRTYRGAFEPEAVFNSICAGFKKAPKICGTFNESTSSIIKGISGMTIVYIVLGLIVLNIFLIYCYRRMSQREMKEDMRMHVNSAVSQYFALSQRENP